MLLSATGRRHPEPSREDTRIASIVTTIAGRRPGGLEVATNVVLNGQGLPAIPATDDRFHTLYRYPYGAIGNQRDDGLGVATAIRCTLIFEDQRVFSSRELGGKNTDLGRSLTNP